MHEHTTVHGFILAYQLSLITERVGNGRSKKFQTEWPRACGLKTAFVDRPPLTHKSVCKYEFSNFVF